jgi:oxygen-independent coproporphyrinogen-3 oxidase
MCNFIVKRKSIEACYGIDFESYFAESLKQLQPYVDDGMARIDNEGIHAIAHGQVFVRNLAMCFDAHLANKLDRNKPVFSRTV